jgi:acetate---CoA ligase (ADP-forming)
VRMRNIMHKLFYNDSVAVIGVSQSDDNLGKYIVENLVTFGYQGEIYPVGPRGGELFGRRIYRTVAEVPGSPDIAVILTPARFIPQIVRQCGEKGIRWGLIESGGFRELGPEGEQLERELLETSREYDFRFVGPNCIGLANAHNGFYTPFVPLPYPYRKGKVGVFAQSGGVGLTLAERLTTSGVGVSKMVSMGNKLSLDEIDYLSYLIDDPDTEIIYLYLEDFKRGRGFAEAAGRSPKPIVLHKSNTSHLSRSIARSHTAALASDDEVVNAVCLQTGICRVHSVAQALTAIKGLSLPALRGRNLAVISRSGGHAVVAADACAKSGFALPPLRDSIHREVEKHARAGVIRPGNPLDLGDVFDLDFYYRVVEAALRQEDLHGIAFIHVSHMMSERQATRNLIERLGALCTEYGKPIAIVVEVPLEERALLEKTATFPFFLEPTDAVQGLEVLHRYGIPERRKIMNARPPTGDNPAGDITGWVEGFDGENRQPLLHEALELLGRMDIPVVPWQMTTSLEHALSAAAKIGYPIALKAASHSLLHKSDKGGIALNVEGPMRLEAEWRRLHSVSDDLAGIVVQKMLPGFREIIVGAKQDPSFGPVVLVGMGGIMVEVFKDVSMRLAPVEKPEALEMLDRLQGRNILGKFRGMKEADLQLTAEIIVQVSKLIHNFPQIREIDINPLSLDGDGNRPIALDARVIMGTVL